MSTKKDITIDQGAEFTIMIQLKTKVPDGCTDDCSIIPYDLTDKSIVAQVKTTFAACEFVAFVPEIVDAEEGIFKLFLGATVTADMKAGTYVWDVKVVDDNNPDYAFRPFYGNATVTAEVTK